jgi:putative membrane protein insertion efficiency factor
MTAKARRAVPLPARGALFAVRVYQAYLSHLFGGSCRFQPTCSQYAYEAIERFGVARGTWLALRRLLCCHPLSRKFGFDPVPERDETECAGLQPATTSSCSAADEVRV